MIELSRQCWVFWPSPRATKLSCRTGSILESWRNMDTPNVRRTGHGRKSPRSTCPDLGNLRQEVWDIWQLHTSKYGRASESESEIIRVLSWCHQCKQTVCAISTMKHAKPGCHWVPTRQIFYATCQTVLSLQRISLPSIRSDSMTDCFAPMSESWACGIWHSRRLWVVALCVPVWMLFAECRQADRLTDTRCVLIRSLHHRRRLWVVAVCMLFAECRQEDRLTDTKCVWIRSQTTSSTGLSKGSPLPTLLLSTGHWNGQTFWMHSSPITSLIHCWTENLNFSLCFATHTKWSQWAWLWITICMILSLDGDSFLLEVMIISISGS